MTRFYFLIALLISGSCCQASTDAQQIAQKIWDRADGDFVSRQLTMELIDPNGKVMTRKAEVLRGIWQGIKKTRIQFLAPRRVKNTGFLTYDYLDASQTDEQWMYLPALRRERRIPASDRGDNFMGSEFSYEDIKSELKFPLQDYHFELISGNALEYRLSGTPKTPELAEELGYGKFEVSVDNQTWLPKVIDFWDLQMRPLKQIKVMETDTVAGFHVATDILVENIQTGHQSLFTYTDIQYQDKLDKALFTVGAIRK